MKELRYRILFLASWYPNRTNDMLGMFVRRKAEAVSNHCDVAVLFVTIDETLKCKNYEFESGYEKGIFTVRVYYKPVLSGLVKKIFKHARYLKGHYLGLNILKKEWGYYNFVHVNGTNKAGLIAFLLKKIKGTKYVISEYYRPEIRLLNNSTFLSKKVIRNAEFINADSSSTLNYLNKTGYSGDFSIIPEVVEILPQFKSFEKTNIDNINRAIHISNLAEGKNITDIIKAYSHIYNNLNKKNVEFHIVGTGEQKEMLIKLASDLGVLDKCIFFHGFVDEYKKIELLVNSDFHIINSDEDGFSVVTAESILYGIPVIVTKCGGPEDFVSEKVGLLINRRNPKELTDAILYMIDQSKYYNKKDIKKYGSSIFSREVISNQIYQLYKNYITYWKAGNTGSEIRVLPEWNVLDIGSGHQPNRRANVLVERYLSPTIHRTIQKVVHPDDKYLIVADAHFLPFKDKSFDFTIASHIAEHIDDPEKFCLELQRVSKSGYVETPGPLTEFMMPTPSHKWIVDKKNNAVRFRTNNYKKPFSQMFFRIFYLYSEENIKGGLNSSNKLLVMLNFIITKTWKILPKAYTIIRWDKELKAEVIKE